MCCYGLCAGCVHQSIGAASLAAAPANACTWLAADEGDTEQSQGGGRRRRAAADVDPGSTLESSFDALNVKKFDLAFAVDPLFHKMSAQFDEGGASGGHCAQRHCINGSVG